MERPRQYQGSYIYIYLLSFAICSRDFKQDIFIYQGYNHSHPGEIVQELINFAADRVNDNPFIYLEVSEENNPRKSFDLNFYQANIPLQNIQHYLGKIRQHYEINAHSFNYFYQQIGSKNLGHLSGGIDRQGKDFLTIYYEV